MSACDSTPANVLGAGMFVHHTYCMIVSLCTIFIPNIQHTRGLYMVLKRYIPRRCGTEVINTCMIHQRGYVLHMSILVLVLAFSGTEIIRGCKLPAQSIHQVTEQSITLTNREVDEARGGLIRLSLIHI